MMVYLRPRGKQSELHSTFVEESDSASSDCVIWIMQWILTACLNSWKVFSDFSHVDETEEAQ